MYTNNGVTYVYNEKNSNGAPIATLPAESEVTLLYSNNENWAYVEFDTDSYGYILMKYLSDEIEEVQETRYVIPAELKLYQEASTKSDYITVEVASEVTYLGAYGTGSYHKVIYESNRYFIYAPNGIDTRLTTDYDKLMNGIGTKTVTAKTNLRTSMNTSSTDNVIKLLYSGTEVLVITTSDSGAWSYVKLEDGNHGYLLSKYLN
jgi:uncharacterized protein YgiM (DUF1202 family)